MHWICQMHFPDQTTLRWPTTQIPGGGKPRDIHTPTYHHALFVVELRLPLLCPLPFNLNWKWLQSSAQTSSSLIQSDSMYTRPTLRGVLQGTVRGQLTSEAKTMPLRMWVVVCVQW